ncbi:MAG: gamma-glutamyl-gamma-aminobutyrate hydrolase family protein [Armatimonadetes bacterium]|nr:gamma-glutamyl-gamma-aminobutyrate hydrolase family protein [Armatimonadota bacterium]
MIGITLPSHTPDQRAQRRADRIIRQYRRALEAHGARLVELSPDSAGWSLDGLDGLLLTGGGDVDPRRYGRRAHPKTADIDPPRDEMELKLSRRGLKRGLPMLGICRGAQVLGVALGGELVQDIPSQGADAQQHAPREGAKSPRHWVALAPDRRLRAILGADRVRVNSFHHQANGRLGATAQAAAWSPDGVVEAIEATGSAFVIGVQWHPERMWRRAPRQGRLLAAFTTAAQEYADTGR